MVREQNVLMDFFGLLKKNVSDTSTSGGAYSLTSLNDTTEDGIDRWRQNLSVPQQMFKDAKAEKRIMGNFY
jgi:hypothetical protein